MTRTAPEPLGRRFLTALLLLTAAVFLYMIRAFLVPMLLAAVFATLFYPLFRRFLRALRGRRALAAALCCLVFLVGLLLPLYFVGTLVVKEALRLYGSVQEEVQAIVGGQTPPLLLRLQENPWFDRLQLDQVDWVATAQSVAGGVGRTLGLVVRKTSRGTLDVILSIAITIFTMFYFLLDGERLTRRLRRLSPLSAAHNMALLERFAAVSRATVRGTFVIALIQTLLGTLALWLFGVPQPFFWGVVMLVMAIIPMVGTSVVLVPAAIYQIATGSLWQGIGILAVSFGVVFNVDNVLRPRLVGREAGMHDLLIFFSTLGGLATFGAMGFIVGPIIAAFFVALLDIYATEFASELADQEAPAAPAAPAPVPVRPPEEAT